MQLKMRTNEIIHALRGTWILCMPRVSFNWVQPGSTTFYGLENIAELCVYSDKQLSREVILGSYRVELATCFQCQVKLQEEAVSLEPIHSRPVFSNEDGESWFKGRE